MAMILVWLALLVLLVVVAVGDNRGAGALTISYYLGLSLIHVPGALAVIDPLSPVSNRHLTEVGFEVTLWGLASFVAGGIAARLSDRVPLHSNLSYADDVPWLEKTAWRLVAVGALTYFVLMPIAMKFASLTSLVSALSTLLVLGLWIAIYAGSVSSSSRRMVTALILLPFLPLATLSAFGFLGYGVVWVITILSFLFVLSRRRMIFVLAAPAAVYLGLSLFVTYMSERTGIRDVVWNEQSTLSDRLDRMAKLATNFQFLDLSDPAHLELLNGRLNQNFLVGAMVERYEGGLFELAYGSTIPLWALIPRVVWPDKPDVGGGGSLVAEYAGMSFAEGTSVGTGQPAEFYINLGIPGVLLGFFGLGFLLIRLDRGIVRAISSGDLGGLFLRAIPGLTLLQPGGNLLEILVATVAAVLVAILLKRFGGVFHWGKRTPTARRPA